MNSPSNHKTQKPSRGQRRRGFTLIEVMVAIGVLAICFTAIFNVQASSIQAASRTKYITAATLLAHSKMVDIEQQLNVEGFSEFAEDMEGTFEEEGWPEFRWRAKILKVRIPIPSNMPGESDSNSDSSSENSTNNVYASMISGYSTMISDIISGALREVNLVVEWDEGADRRELSLSTHFADLARASQLQTTNSGGNTTGTNGNTSSNTNNTTNTTGTKTKTISIGGK